jgi:hypothetical protein
VTENALLDALKSAMKTPAGAEGMATVELCEATGWGGERVKMALRSAIKAGTATAGRAYRPGIDGVMRPVPVYRLAKKK